MTPKMQIRRPASPLLIVSANPEFREELVELMELEGYEVESAATAEVAMKWAAANHVTGTIIYDCRKRGDWHEFHRALEGPVLDDLAVIRIMRQDDLIHSDGAFCLADPVRPLELLELVRLLCGAPVPREDKESSRPSLRLVR